MKPPSLRPSGGMGSRQQLSHHRSSKGRARGVSLAKIGSIFAIVAILFNLAAILYVYRRKDDLANADDGGSTPNAKEKYQSNQIVAKGDTNADRGLTPEKKETFQSNHPIPKGDRISQPKATIAYAVTLTSCSTDDYKEQTQPFAQGGAVLAHSIYKNSFEHSSSGSKYAHKLYAFVHPDAVSCSDELASLGFHILVRDTPINATEIKGKFLREHVVKSGCCGEKEYIKLYSYTLLDHPVVVHLDLDVLMLKPFDDLFDAMLDGPDSPARERIKLMFPNATSVEKSLPSRINAYFTRDYNMVNPGHKHVGVQGGFLVVRPNLTVFEEYRSIILKGNFFQGSGWDGKGYGGYYGAQQIQGICSYYYDHLHPGEAAELNRCYYNAMADDPIQRSSGKCRTGEDVCEDCKVKNINEIYSVHFTLCNKPWLCRHKSEPLCQKMHHEWFRMRKDLDISQAQRRQKIDAKKEVENHLASGEYKPEQYMGYCKHGGNKGYVLYDVSSFVMDQ